MPLFGSSNLGMKGKRDVTGLIQSLKHKDPKARRAALAALGKLRDKITIGPITELLLADEKHLGDKIEAAEALGTIGDEAAVEALVQASETSLQRERGTIDATLAENDRRYRDGFYVNRIAADEYQLRVTIAHALMRIGGIRAAAALFDLLATENGNMASNVKRTIRGAIAETLAPIGAAAIPLLCDALKQPAEDVRDCAVYCLGECPSSQTMDALIEVLQNTEETFAVREAAIINLGKIGDASVLPDLEKIARAEHRGLARDAEQAISAIRARLNLPGRVVGF